MSEESSEKEKDKLSKELFQINKIISEINPEVIKENDKIEKIDLTMKSDKKRLCRFLSDNPKYFFKKVYTFCRI